MQEDYGQGFLEALPSVFYRRVLPDGRFVEVIPLTFGRARLCLGQAHDTLGYSDGW